MEGVEVGVVAGVVLTVEADKELVVEVGVVAGVVVTVEADKESVVRHGCGVEGGGVGRRSLRMI